MGRQKVMVSFSEEFLYEVDRAARDERRSRSEFLREAAAQYLATRREQRVPGRDPEIQRAIAMQDALAEADTQPDWDSTEAVRVWRERASQ